MAGGFAFILCIWVGVAIALVIEIAVAINKKKKKIKDQLIKIKTNLSHWKIRIYGGVSYEIELYYFYG